MTTDDKLKMLNLFQSDLGIVKNVYSKSGFEFNELQLEEESAEYGACSFKLNEKKIKFRISKITPTKTGQFVTIWKRNQNGVIQPFDLADEFDFIIIGSRNIDTLGQFIFPKPILLEKGIISGNNKEGKRGIRVYPPWDRVSSKQAEATQNWQTKYFLAIQNDNSIDIELVKKLIK